MSKLSRLAAKDLPRLAKGPAGRIVGATIAAGMLSGYWTVASMKEQGAPISSRETAAVAEADPVEDPAYDLFGAVAPEDTGYRWAEMARIDAIADCPDASPTFRSGCMRYLTDAARVRVYRAAEPVAVEVVPVVDVPPPVIETEETRFSEEETY